MNEFWLVWNSENDITYRASSESEARKLAEEYAFNDPGGKYALLKSVAVCEVPDTPKWTPTVAATATKSKAKVKVSK